MSKLYVITGPAGVGKSTISKELANSLEKSVFIEGDEIYHQVVGSYIPAWKEGNHLEVFWKVCIQSILIYLENGYDVIFNYIIKKKDIELLDKFIPFEKHFLVLMVDSDTLLRRDQMRPEDCQMKERCLVLLEEFKKENFDKKYILETTNLTIPKIVSKAKEDKFLWKKER